eukprot:ANDGO_05498.mRNA.1 putative catechol O-methyltransferase 2
MSGSILGTLNIMYEEFVKAPFRRVVLGETTEQRVIQHVFTTGTENDPESVLAALDKFGWTDTFLMNVADVKGLILDDVIKQNVLTQPPFDAKNGYVAVEFGGYLGYSAVRIGRLFRDKGKVYSIEKNPYYAAIATKIIEFAGLNGTVRVVVGTAQDRLGDLKTKFGVKKVDFVFQDEWKDVYVADLKALEKSGLLRNGTIIVGDNILFPGVPDYLAYVKEHPQFTSILKTAQLEYSKTVKDAMLISTWYESKLPHTVPKHVDA